MLKAEHLFQRALSVWGATDGSSFGVLADVISTRAPCGESDELELVLALFMPQFQPKLICSKR